MPLSTIASTGIYAHYSKSSASTIISAVVFKDNEKLSVTREYSYDTRRAILVGFIEIYLTQLKPNYELIVYTDNMYLYNIINKIKNNESFKFPMKNQDLIKLLIKSMELFPHINIQYIDESKELVICRAEVLKRIKRRQLSKQLLLDMMKNQS